MSYIAKEFISFEHLNSDYIADQANAIAKELDKKSFDTGYIREKTRNIEAFLSDLESAWGGVRGDLYGKQAK